MKKIISIILIILFIIINNGISIFADNSMYTEKIKIPEISKQEALDIAIDFLSEFAPNIIEDINTDTSLITYTKSYPYCYNIVFPRIIGGIEYSTDNLSVLIDSSNGNIITHSLNFSEGVIFEDTSSIIDKQSATEKYRLAMGISLQYNKKIVNNKIQTYLTYTGENILINAQTGNIISVPYYIPTDGYFDVVNTASKVSQYIDSNDIISISEADEIVRDITELEISSDYRINSVDYLKNQDDTYLITLIYKTTNNTKEVTLNAKTGLLTEYSDYSADINTPNSLNISAEAFVEKYYKEYTGSVIKRKNFDNGYTVLLYERTVDGIPYKSNGLYVSCKDGKIKKVSFSWDNVKFQSTNGILDYDYAYRQFFDKCGLELTYYKRDNGVHTPVYQKSSKGTGIIDAISGRQLNYDGTYYYSAKEMNYLDRYSHYAGYYANKLSDCDIYVSSGSVFLGDYITQQEYLLLISEFINGTKPVLNTTGILTDDQREMLYAYMYSNGIIDRSETNFTGYVTRADAVKYLLRILGHGTVGEMSEIFIPHFDDYEEIPKNLTGYVELARSLGIVKGSGNNKFKPNDFLTNGDSLIMIYNYLEG